ncbi:MAG: hypothetical protein WA666_06330 [Nitrospirota bacterium]
MNKAVAYTILFAGLLIAGTVFAWSGQSGMKGSYDTSSMSSSSQVKAAIVSKSGDTIRLYSSDNKVLCKGDMVPVFRTSTVAERFLPGKTSAKDMENIIAKSDLANAKLIGEIRVNSLVGTNYAEGTLIFGSAAHGDIALKPSAECLSSRG